MGGGGSFSSFTDISTASRTAYFCLEMKFQCSNALEKLKRQQDSCLQFQLANCNYIHTTLICNDKSMAGHSRPTIRSIPALKNMYQQDLD